MFATTELLASKRLAVLRCLDWPAVVAAKTSNSPCAVVHGHRIIARSVGAMHYGVQVGMRRRHAQGLCPDLEIATFQPDRDRRAFNTVVRTVNELVPLIEVTEPGVIVFATRGPSRYFGGDEQMAGKIFQVLRRSIVVDAQFGIGVADSRLAAHIAARISAQNEAPFIVEPDKTKLWLAQQSVRVLSEFVNIDPETVSLLERLGLNTLQDVCRLGESVLAGRFGELGIELHRLARGDEQHPLAAVVAPPEHLCLRIFEEPVVDQQTLLNNVRAMAEEFNNYFAGHGAICVRLVLKFESETGSHSERLWYRPQGLTARAITESAKWQIESWSSKLAVAITRVQLIADEVRTDTARQLKLWGGITQVDETASHAIGRLTELLGSTAVQFVKWQGGRDLQDNFQLVSAAHFQPRPTDSDESNKSSASNAKMKWRGSLPTPSPSVVYSEPPLVQVVDKDKNLLRVSARHELSAEPSHLIVDGQNYKIVSWAGPWPIEEKWWDIARSRRLVRLQLVIEKSTQNGAQQVQALLVTLEHGQWSIAAIYG